MLRWTATTVNFIGDESIGAEPAWALNASAESNRAAKARSPP
jgi:hypothetical protein